MTSVWNDLPYSVFDTQTLDGFKGSSQSMVASLNCVFQFSVEQVTVGFRKQFTNNFVFPRPALLVLIIIIILITNYICILCRHTTPYLQPVTSATTAVTQPYTSNQSHQQPLPLHNHIPPTSHINNHCRYTTIYLQPVTSTTIAFTPHHTSDRSHPQPLPSHYSGHTMNCKITALRD